MPKFPQTPRVSILVPLQRDEARFEETLLSVLENRPDACQVVAVHNGTYADPFDLGDEVTFATARSSKLVDLIRDGYASTEAPVVQVLTSGLRAADGWVDELIERFEDTDLGATAAALSAGDASAAFVSGWSDTAGRFCQPLATSKTQFSSKFPRGFFLPGFAIRRRLLGALLDAVAPAMVDPVAVAYAFGCLISRAGWKVSVASDCPLVCDRDALPSDVSDADRGACLAAIRGVVWPAKSGPGVGALLNAALLGPSSLGEMFGVMRHRGNLPAMRRSIDPQCVPTVDEMATVLSVTRHDRRVRQAA